LKGGKGGTSEKGGNGQKRTRKKMKITYLGDRWALDEVRKGGKIKEEQPRWKRNKGERTIMNKGG